VRHAVYDSSGRYASWLFIRGKPVTTAHDLQLKVGQLREQLIDVMENFGRTNPGIPVQAIMGGLGELLIQFSVGQAGKANTLRLLDHLKEAVEIFGDQISPEH